MEIKTSIGETVTSIDAQKVIFDANAKKILQHKEVAAGILKDIVPQYKGLTIPQIVPLLEYDVHEDSKDTEEHPLLQGIANDVTSNEEGEIRYDSRFTAKYPGSGRPIDFLTCFEPHKMKESYSELLAREIVSLCRMITTQYGVHFTAADYDQVRSAFAVWIIADARVDLRNRMFVSSFPTPESLSLSKVPKDIQQEWLPFSNYMNLVTVFLGDVDTATEPLVQFLDVLFSLKEDPTTKLNRLHNDFGLTVTKPLEKEINNMFMTADDLIVQSKTEGKAEGKAEGIIQTALEYGASKESILAKLRDKLDISTDQAIEFWNMFANVAS